MNSHSAPPAKSSFRCCRFIFFAFVATLVAAGAVHAQNLTATVSVGSNPNAVAANPVTNNPRRAPALSKFSTG